MARDFLQWKVGVGILLEKQPPTSRTKFHNTIVIGINRIETLQSFGITARSLSFSRSHSSSRLHSFFFAPTREMHASSRRWLRFSYIIRRASYPYRLQLQRMHTDWLQHIDLYIEKRTREREREREATSSTRRKAGIASTWPVCTSLSHPG